MAIIYSYPVGIPSASDNLLGTQVDPTTEENKTVQFPISQINSLGASNFLESTITLTQAQMTALNGAPVQLLPPPGLTSYYKILEVSTAKIGAAFAGGAVILAQINSVTQFSLPTSTFTPAGTVVASMTVPFANGTIIGVNGALTTSLATAITAGVGSTYAIKIRYQILNTSAF
tara:strand:+ start:294 stop:815 length:522 start_codon:yes stop_codon:yes gene_type:complete